MESALELEKTRYKTFLDFHKIADQHQDHNVTHVYYYRRAVYITVDTQNPLTSPLSLSVG